MKCEKSRGHPGLPEAWATESWREPEKASRGPEKSRGRREIALICENRRPQITWPEITWATGKRVGPREENPWAPTRKIRIASYQY